MPTGKGLTLGSKLRAIRIEPLDLLLLFCGVLAIRAMLLRGLKVFDGYDEAILFANAQMMADGRVPYRDFYSNYPPGIFQIVRLVTALGIEPIWGMRAMSLGVRIATALCAAWLVGRSRGGVACLATATAVLVIQSRMGTAPFAYALAVLLALVLIAAWPGATAHRWQRVASGMLLGCMSYLRHDLVTYALPLFVTAEAVSWWLHRRTFFFASPRQLGEFVIGAGMTALLLWMPVFATAGFWRVLHDLALDQAAVVLPARKLPIPSMIEPVAIGGLNLNLPGAIAQHVRFGIVLAAVGSCTGTFAAVRALAAKSERTPGSRVSVLIAIFSIATLPQALGRTDYLHVAFIVPVVLTAALCALGRRTAELIALISLIPWFSGTTRFIGPTDALYLARADDSAFIPPERKRLADFVRAQTAPGEPIFVGCASHRQIITNPLDIYYLARRPGATRYMQFDPGLATSHQGQSEMVTDLQRTRPRIVLRLDECLAEQPNAPQLDGSSLLDAYLDAHYAPREIIEGSTVWRPKSGAP